ncbi:MAG: 30S ribosomal protein S20 [Chitinispirillaceae bacterium]|jgi:small subunit ribosomal protein S20|nr:30S ribosomal protein S20 [Chitinispirillaceae bacterium]
MQRHKSAEKAARKSRKTNVVNRELRSRIKTAISKVLAIKEKKAGTDAMQTAFSILDKSVKTKLIHANNAANKKSRLSKHINTLSK